MVISFVIEVNQMEKIKYGSWTDWIKFEDLYEYYGLINKDLKSNRGSTIEWDIRQAFAG